MDRSTLDGLNENSVANSPLEKMSTTGYLEGEYSAGRDFSSNENIGQNDEVDKINTVDDARIDTETLSTKEEIKRDSSDFEVAHKDEKTPNISTENLVNSSEDALTNINGGTAAGSADNEVSASIGSENSITETDINQNKQIDTQVDTEVDTIKDNNDELSQSLSNTIEDRTEKEASIDSVEDLKKTLDSRNSTVDKDSVNKESDQSDVSDNLKEDGLLLTNNKSNSTSPEGSTVPEINDYRITNKPTKRKRDEILTNYEPIDPTSFQTEKNKKRITGKFIDKFWEPLDVQTTSSLEKILNMCVNRTIEKYKGGSKVSKKMMEAQHLLSKNWLNELNRKSFRSRLNVTNVPLPSTMQSTSKSIDNSLDILNYDQLTRRTQFLETYLLAELKQLSDLETYFSDLEMIYNLDLNYLNEFKKTTEINKSKMIKETITKREKLNLDNIEPDSENIRLADNPEITNSNFDPNSDNDTQDVLQLIDKQLQSLSSDTTNLTNLNEKLETLYNFLNKC